MIPETITVNENHTEKSELHGTYRVTALSAGAFGGSGVGNRWEGNSAIESVVIPNSVTQIGAHAFRECKKLKSVTLSSQVTELYNATFYNCSGLTDFDINGAKLSFLDAYVFSGCSSLEELDLGECPIDSIPNNLFYGCSKLQTIEGINWNSIKSYGTSCFQNCGKINFPISPVATVFKSSAFWGCSSITGDVVLSSDTTEIGDHAFRSTAITSIVVRMSDKSTQKSFNNANFFGCSKLKYAVLPDNIQTIGQYTFSGCSSLEYLILGSGITSFSTNNTFTSCGALKAIIYQGSEDGFKALTGISVLGTVEYKPFSEYVHGSLPAKRTVYYGATVCDKCNGILSQEGFIFKDLLSEMKIGQACVHCGDENITNKFEPVFVDLGYSTFVNNGTCSVMQGFKVNYDALSFYNENCEDKIGAFGVLAVADVKVDDAAFDENGAALNGVLNYEIKTGHNYFDIKVASIPLDAMLDNETAYVDAKLHLCAYVFVGEDIYYVSAGHVGTTLGNAVSYNDVKPVIE